MQHADADENAPARPAGRRRLAWEAACSALTAGGAVAGAAVVLRLWRARLGVPFTYTGDGKMTLGLAQNVLETGWFLHGERLGAPLGQRLHDFPWPGDTLNMLELRLLGLFSDDAAVVVNSFYLLSFALIAAAAYLALRHVRVSRPFSVAAGVLYACLPFHFLLGESHLFLSNYWVVPLACVLVVRQFGPSPLLDVPRGAIRSRRLRPLRRPPALAAMGVALLAGTTGLYYAAFTAVLLVAAGIARAAAERRSGPLVASTLLAGIVLAAVAASLLPSLLHIAEHGRNAEVANRTFGETEYYGLRILNLVAPVDGHRIDALGEVRARSAASPVAGEGSETLGLVGAAGFVGLLVVAITRLAGRRREEEGDGGDADADVVGPLSAATLVCVLVGTVSGFSAVVAALGFTSLRGWNRISVFIAFFSLAAAAWAGDRLWSRLRGRWLRPAHVVVAGLVATAGIWDATTPRMAPDHHALAAEWDADRRFVGRVEALLGRGATVFQLPYAPFPEIAPIVDMADYEHLRGYIHSKTLRWSYGAMKGRPESAWQATVARVEPSPLLRTLALVGTDGLWIDRLAYRDRAHDLVARIQAVVGGGPALASGDDRFVVFDLRAYGAGVRAPHSPEALAAARDALLYPPLVAWGAGFHDEESGPDERWRWAGATATVARVNEDEHDRQVSVRFGVGGAPPASTLVATWPGGSQRLTVTPDRQPVELDLLLPPGRTTLTFSSDAPAVLAPPGTRDVRFRVFDFAVVDVAVWPFTGL